MNNQKVSECKNITCHLSEQDPYCQGPLTLGPPPAYLPKTEIIYLSR